MLYFTTNWKLIRKKKENSKFKNLRWKAKFYITNLVGFQMKRENIKSETYKFQRNKKVFIKRKEKKWKTFAKQEDWTVTLDKIYK